MDKPNTDWNLVVQANISLLWCQLASDPQKQDMTLKQILEDFKRNNQNCNPLNLGTLLMASYILFVYPQQAEFQKLDFSRFNTSKFNVLIGTPNNKHKRFCSRIRNALTHGRVRFDNTSNLFKFSDMRSDGGDKFVATISIGNYGDFINQFMIEAKKQGLS